MRIVVTGATGYLGWHVAVALRRAGHRVIGLVRSQTKARRLWAAEIEAVVGTMDEPASYARAISTAAAPWCTPRSTTRAAARNSSWCPSRS